MAHDDFPGLRVRVIGVVEDPGERVSENGHRFVEGHTVFRQVGSRFRRMPLENQAHAGAGYQRGTLAGSVLQGGKIPGWQDPWLALDAGIRAECEREARGQSA
jgi:hypothetical protein